MATRACTAPPHVSNKGGGSKAEAELGSEERSNDQGGIVDDEKKTKNVNGNNNPWIEPPVLSR